MRVLITRPGEDGANLAEVFSEQGIESVLEPLLTIKNMSGPALNLKNDQALLLTSANGVRAVAKRTDRRDIPLYAVGDATAHAARSAGFLQVHSAAGDVQALAALVKDRLDPKAGPLVHIAGTDVVGDLGADLTKAGFTCRREVLYEAELVRSLSASTIASIKDQTIDSVVFYSPRTAESFVGLVRKARLVQAVRKLTALCLSQAVADKISDLTWKEIAVADHPTPAELFKTIRLKAGLKVDDDDKSADSKIAASDIPSSHFSAPIQRPRTGAVRTIFLTLLVVVAAIAIAAAAKPLWLPQLVQAFPFLKDNGQNKSRIDALTIRLDELERQSALNIPDLKTLDSEKQRLEKQLQSTLNRLTKLENSIGDVKKNVAAVNLDARPNEAEKTLRQLSSRLSALEKSEASRDGGNRERLDRLSGQVSELERKFPSATSNDAAMTTNSILLGIGQLREAVRAERPFANELVSLKTIAGGNEAILDILNKMEKYAVDGAFAKAKLQDRFADLAGRLVRAESIPQGDGWIERTIDRLTQSIKWRRTDELDGPGIDAIVARAERELASGKVSRAVIELSSLPAKAKILARKWLTAARKFVDVEQALIDLQTIVVADIAAQSFAQPKSKNPRLNPGTETPK